VTVNGRKSVITKVVDLDLDAPSSSNEIETLENSLPFCRGLIVPFCDHVRKAEKLAGGDGYVTIDSLKEEFASPAWESLNNRDSILVRILLSSAFKNNDKGITHEDHICADTLKLFGILHCQGNPKDKAEEFYNLLQEGGKAQHPKISANDKDLKPVFQKMCDFVTRDIFVTFSRIAGKEVLYEENEL
jgi:hypothetical protein